LELLRKFGIRATFFVLGDNVVKYPELALQVATEMHAVGCHGMSHRSLFLKSRALQYSQIVRAKAAIEEKVGATPRLFRPPFGHFDRTTLLLSRQAGMKLVMWDVDSRDFTLRSLRETRSEILRQVRQGSIILLHDNELTAGRVRDYLTAIIEGCLEHGFTFASVPL
jgi:peptidoglycan/xylan/chitin deacetylase (PgdA/CDA1 family)